MKNINIAGAVLLIAVCASAVSGQTCTQADYINYTDGTDFYGNDINTGTPNSTPNSCIAACEADNACYAIVLKSDGICWLKGENYKANVQNLDTTDLAVDMSCLRTGEPATPITPTKPGAPGSPTTPGSPDAPAAPGTPATPGTPSDGTGTDNPPAAIPPVTNADGTVTSKSVTEFASGTYVATEVTYNPKNFNSDTTDDVDGTPTAVSYYSDAAGTQLTDADAIGNPTVAVMGQDIVATTTVPDQTDPIVTTVTTNPTDGSATGVTSTGGVTAQAPGTPTTPGEPTAPATPPGTEGNITTDQATGYTTMVNTVMVPNTEPPQYVTMNTTVDGDFKEVPDMSKAYYSDADGNPVDPPAGAPPLNMTTTSNPTAVPPEPRVVSSVNVTDSNGDPVKLTSSAYVTADGTATTYGANPSDVAAAGGTGTLPPGVTAAPPPPGGLGGTPAPPPGGSRNVNVTTTESGGATGLQMLSAVFAISMFGALML